MDHDLGDEQVAPDGREPEWLTPQEQYSWRVYLRGVRQLWVALDRDLAVVDMSLPEYEVLSMLSESSGESARMSLLAEMVVQSRSRLTHTVKRLESRGWVERSPSVHDRRGVVVGLTDEGRAQLERAARVHVASVRQHMLSAITTDQLHTLGAAMGRISEGLEDLPDLPARRHPDAGTPPTSPS